MVTLLLESIPLIYMMFMGDRTRKTTSYMVLIIFLSSFFSIFTSSTIALALAYSISLLLILPNMVRRNLPLLTWIMLSLTLFIRGLYNYYLFLPLILICLVMIFKREYFSMILGVSSAFMFSTLISEIYFLTPPLSVLILLLFSAIAAYMQSPRKKETSTN